MEEERGSERRNKERGRGEIIKNNTGFRCAAVLQDDRSDG